MIVTVDLHFQGERGAIAAHLWPLAQGGFAVVDPGPGSTLPRLVEGMRHAGFDPADLRAILVSHVHLDHAGAAGALAQRTGATVIAHPRAASHLIDPSRLWRSAQRVYGDAMEHLWGGMESVPAEQVRVVAGGERVTIAGTRVHVIEAPGHARHQHAYASDDGDLFPGDACAIRFPGSRVIVPATAPPEIDLHAWPATLAAFAEAGIRTAWLPHFGAIVGEGAVRDHLERVRVGLIVWSELVTSALALGEEAAAIADRLEAFIRRSFAVEGMDALAERGVRSAGPRMSVDGLVRALAPRAS